MNNKLVLFLKNSFIYFIGTVSSKLVSLLLVPLYTAYLDPAFFGIYDYTMTILSFVAPICFFQIWDAMYRFSFEHKGASYKAEVVTNTLIVFFVGLFFYTVVIFVGSKFFIIDNLLWVYFCGICWACNYLYTYLARSERQNTLFSISGFVNSLSIGGGSYYLIVYAQMGIESLYIAFIIGALLQCLIINICINPFKMISFDSFNYDIIIKMLKFSAPLCIASVSYWLLSGFTKFSIVHYAGSYDNGIYAIASRLANVLNTVVLVFQFAWNEIAYIANEENDRTVLYTNVIKMIAIIIFYISGILIATSEIVFSLFISKSYYVAIQYFPLAVLSVSLNAIAGFMNIVFMAEKETKFIFWSTAVASITNCILSIYLTSIFGLYGALIALNISFAVLLIIRFVFLRIRLKHKYSFTILKGGFFFIISWLLFIFKIQYIYVYFVLFTIITIDCYFNRRVLATCGNIVWKKVKR